MIALDTNLWARAILGDDPRQSPPAQRAITCAAAETGIFIPLLVLVELGWVLKGAPGWDSHRVHQAMERLLNMEGIEVEDSPLAREALNLSTGTVGLSDHVIALKARERGCTRLLTFDLRFARTGKAELLEG